MELIHELRSDHYRASSDRSLLDMDVIHGFLVRAYWCEGIPRATVERAVANSFPVGAYHAGQQVGFARAVTDYATFAYVADVFVLESHRGHGVGKLLIACLTSHPELQHLRTWMLLTRDAHGLYRQYGFDAPHNPERVMVKQDLDLYKRG